MATKIRTVKKPLFRESSIKKQEVTKEIELPKTIDISFLEKTQLELMTLKIENYNLKIENFNLEKKSQINEMNKLISSIRKNHNISPEYIFDLKSNTFKITENLSLKN